MMHKTGLLVAILTVVLLQGGCATTTQQAAEGAPPPLKTELDPTEQSRFMEDYARLLLDAGRHGEAENLLEALHRSQPDDLDTLRLLARAYEAEGRTSLALLAWEELLRLSTSTTDAAEYARLALLNKQFEKAEAVYRNWLERTGANTPLQVTAHNNLGYSKLLQGEAKEAQAHFEQALRLDPLDRRARGNLALSHELDGRPELAAAQWQILGRTSGAAAP